MVSVLAYWPKHEPFIRGISPRYFSSSGKSFWILHCIIDFLYVLYTITQRLRTCERSIVSQKTLIVIAVPVSEFSFQFTSDVMLMNMVNILGMFVEFPCPHS